MRLLAAIAIGLLLGGGLAWWLVRPATEPSRRETRAEREEATRAPTLYRWRDDRGVLQVTQDPPADRPYELVDIPPERNIVPMRPPTDEERDD